MKLGLQAYTVRDSLKQDFNGTLQRIKEIGYDGIELAGLYGIEPTEIKKILDTLELPAISAHVPYDELIENTSNTITKYKSIGCKFITIPYLKDEDRPGKSGFEKVLENIAKIGQECKKQGIILLYHNHDFEFTRLENNIYGLDFIYSEITQDILQTELDTCWIKVVGEDPCEYIEKYRNRCPIVHLKDFTGIKSGHMYELIGINQNEATCESEFKFTPVGYGVQNFPKILSACSKSSTEWLIVEQDKTYELNSIEAASLSFKYLKKYM